MLYFSDSNSVCICQILQAGFHLKCSTVVTLANLIICSQSVCIYPVFIYKYTLFPVSKRRKYVIQFSLLLQMLHVEDLLKDRMTRWGCKLSNPVMTDYLLCQQGSWKMQAKTKSWQNSETAFFYIRQVTKCQPQHTITSGVIYFSLICPSSALDPPTPPPLHASHPPIWQSYSLHY